MKRLLFRHDPKLFFKYLYAGAKSLILRWPKAPIEKRINGILFEFDFDLDPVIRLVRNPLSAVMQYPGIQVKPNILPMYYGAYEPDTVRVMRKLLRKGDTFIDVGANIGYLSGIAMGLVGKTGYVHSFEPVPEYFDRLINLAVANKEYKVIINQCALGDEQGSARIDVVGLENIGMSTMVSGLVKKEMVKKKIRVAVYRLDEYIKEKSIDKVSLIKIDAEGFEFPVLRGLSGYFESGHHPTIICDIHISAYSLLGYTLTQVSEYMKRQNYHSFGLDQDTEIDITNLKENTYVMFSSMN